MKSARTKSCQRQILGPLSLPKKNTTFYAAHKGLVPHRVSTRRLSMPASFQIISENEEEQNDDDDEGEQDEDQVQVGGKKSKIVSAATKHGATTEAKQLEPTRKYKRKKKVAKKQFEATATATTIVPHTEIRPSTPRGDLVDDCGMCAFYYSLQSI